MPYVGRDQYYKEPLAQESAIWGDLYALTMAQALWLEGRHNQVTTFHAFIRQSPFKGAYLVTGGQNIVAEWLDNWHYDDVDIYRLSQKTVINPKTGKEEKLFRPEFLEILKNAKLELSVDMMQEGELAFPAEPIYRVSGPVWQCLAVEAAILNAMNSQSGFATYASHLKSAANYKTLAEFGLRRAQAIGGLESSRGAYIGGADVTSNTLAEKYYGIKTIGTMAHAYVMLHDTEFDAYVNWARHNPNLGIFLPDTYEPVEGMKKVIEACKQEGIVLRGERQDSGDLGYLQTLGFKFAQSAGFQPDSNVISNDLGIENIAALEAANTPNDIYAVGTKLATMWEQPAIGGVYKIANSYDQSLSHEEIVAMKAAVRAGAVDPHDIRDKVRDIMKLSSQLIKMTYPGELDLVRYLAERDGKLMFDGGTIYPEWAPDPLKFDDPKDEFSGHLTRDIMSVSRDNNIISKTFNAGTRAYRPIQPMFVQGKLVGNIETVQMARARAQQRLAMLDESHKRRVNPHEHVVGVEETLLQRQAAMGRRLRQTGNTVLANQVK